MYMTKDPIIPLTAVTNEGQRIGGIPFFFLVQGHTASVKENVALWSPVEANSDFALSLVTVHRINLIKCFTSN